LPVCVYALGLAEKRPENSKKDRKIALLSLQGGGRVTEKRPKNSTIKPLSVPHKDVEAVEYFLLPLPAPYKVRFRVCSRFQLPQKFNRFHRFRFQLPLIVL